MARKELRKLLQRMSLRPRNYTWAVLLAFLGFTVAGHAQAQVTRVPAAAAERAGQVFDSVGRALEHLFGAGWDIGDPRGTPFSTTRSLDERFPVGPRPVVSIENEFGAVRIAAWDEPLVQVSGEIAVRANSTGTAARIAQTIGLEAQASDGVISVRTLFPEPPRSAGPLAFDGAINVTVPRDATVLVQNGFGATGAAGLGGPLTLQSRYGPVSLQNLDGTVEVQSDGAFPVQVRGLRAGGRFLLNGALAQFRDVAGPLDIRCFQGALDIETPVTGAQISVHSEGAPVRLAVPAGAEPDIRADVRYGALDSAWPVVRPTDTLAQSQNVRPEAGLKIALDASFADVRLETTDAPVRPQPDGNAPVPELKPFSETAMRTESAPPDSTLVINAIIGDVRIEAIDGNAITLSEDRQVWTAGASQAPALLDRLRVDLRRETGRVVVTSSASAVENAPLPEHRIDLVVQCPRSMPVEVHATHGLTYLSGLSSAVTVSQGAGTLAVQNITGPLTLDNRDGRIQTTDCEGELAMTVRRGDALVRRHSGPIRIDGEGSPIRVEAVSGDIYIRNAGNDVRILAQDGLSGSIDAQVLGGNVSLALPAEPDLDLSASSVDGLVRSVIPLTGTVEKNRQDFHVVLGQGAYRVRLEAQNGDLYVN